MDTPESQLDYPSTATDTHSPATHTSQALDYYLPPSEVNKLAPYPVLCGPCRDLLQHMDSKVGQEGPVKQSTFISVHHRRSEALKSSALRGCPVCSLICRKLTWISEHERDEKIWSHKYALEMKMPKREGSSPKCSVDDTCRVLYLPIMKDSNSQSGVDVVRFAFDHMPWSMCPKPPPRSTRYTSTASEELFNVAREWLEKCGSWHGRCKRHLEASNAFLPSRLLRVVQSRRENFIRVKLVENPHSSDLQEDRALEYVTLSHCWGGIQPLRLDRSTYSRLVTGIRIDELPKTYREAALVTIKLGYFWLWIDSLCIVQDVPQDWEREANLMGKVYNNRALNLAAADAPNCHSGLFATRDPLSLTAFVYDGSCEKRYDCNVNPDLNIRTRPSGYSKHHRVPKLRSRGWALQELALSPRTLYYLEDTLSWECHGGMASESDPNIVDTWWSWSPGIKKSFSENVLSPANWKTFVHSDSGWGKIVQCYSASQFIFWKDRYYAFLGLSSVAEELSGRRLLLGLWRDDLTRQLAWRRVGSPTSLRLLWLPTWSWIAITPEVDYAHLRYYTKDGGHVFYDILVPCATIMDIPIVDTKFSERTSLPFSGWKIVLQVPMPRVAISEQEMQQDVINLNSEWGHLEITLDMKDHMEFHIFALLKSEVHPLLKGLVVAPSPVDQNFWIRAGCFGSEGIDRDGLKSSESRCISLI